MNSIAYYLGGVREVLGATLLDRTELINPYLLESNTEQTLAKGWGLAVGSSVEGPSEFSQTDNITTEFNIVLTGRVVGVNQSATKSFEAVQDLLDSADTVRERMQFWAELRNGQVGVLFLNQTAPEPVAVSDDTQYLSMTLAYSLVWSKLIKE